MTGEIDNWRFGDDGTYAVTMSGPHLGETSLTVEVDFEETEFPMPVVLELLKRAGYER